MSYLRYLCLFSLGCAFVLSSSCVLCTLFKNAFNSYNYI